MKTSAHNATFGRDAALRRSRPRAADGTAGYGETIAFAVAPLCAARTAQRAVPTRCFGFSLLEVMIAILILGIAIVGFTQGITTALSSGKESELQTTASLFAAGQIEKLRAEGGIKDGDTDGDCGDDLPLYHWKQSITAAGIDGLHEVVITVEDTRSSKPVYELRTFLFERPEDTDSTKDKSRNRNSSSSGGASGGGRTR
jgi:prepilin-type N-terminal cleavage/methylation domain-containing protein